MAAPASLSLKVTGGALLTALAIALVAGGGSRAASPAETQRSAAVRTVAIVTDNTLAPAARHGLAKLEDAFRARHVGVVMGSAGAGTADLVVLAGAGAADGPAATALVRMKVPLPVKAQALVIRKGAEYRNRPAIVLAGADGVGLMYAALDTADRIGWAPAGGDLLQFVGDTSEQPYLDERGVTIFTMNRGYFESRLHDEQYWVRYFDMLADDRINELALTFGYEDGGYMAPPYPYFFDVDGFPDVKVVGQTVEEQTRNRTALQTMIRLAAERGIRIKPGIWDHIYRGGGQRGGVAGASDGTKPTPGLVWGLDGTNLVPYTVAALKKFYEVFPEFTVTQFRMHDESGLKQDEIAPFWHDVFGFFSTSKRDESLELRAKGLDKSVVRDAQSQGLTVNLETKIWMEQMGLPYHPTHINPENQRDARQSYADLLEYPRTYHVDWTLWNGGTTRILLWADPDYVRRMAESAKLYDGQSLVVTEMEATKMHGDPHDAPPRDFVTARYRYVDYEFERYWAFYRVWGRLSYDPHASDDLWAREFVRKFGPDAGPHLMKAQQLSSRVLPRIVAASVPYSVFPTTQGWPEMMHLGSLPRYAATEEGSDVQQFMNVRDDATSLIDGTDTAMRRPEDTSRWFAATADAILAEVAAAERTSGGHAGNEFRSTAIDARILAGLARYHSWRLLAAVNYNVYKQAGSLAAFDDAIANERQAIQAWREMVDAAGDFYSDNMAFGPAPKGFPRHWKDELPAMDREFDQLIAERRAAPNRPDAKSVRLRSREPSAAPPVVTLEPPGVAMPGRDLVVRAMVRAPAGVKWIRLRYRHVNQHEDYLSADMTPDPHTGAYVASIPAAFIDPRWDLMYFVEIVDRQGTGRMYPDLDTETPYVMVSVAR